MKKTLLTLSAILVAGAIALPSLADDKSDADKLFKDGISSYEKKDYEVARNRFADSYAKYPSPNALFNLARVEQVLGKNLDAYRHYQAYSQLPENPKVTPAERAEAKQRIQEILTKIGRIVVVAPQGAKIVLDGVALENQTESVPVEPGAHTVDLIVMNETRKKTVTCGAGEIHQVKWDEQGAAPVTDGGAPEATDAGTTGPVETTDGGVPPGGDTGTGKPSPLIVPGLVVGGVGLLGLIGGFTFGMLSKGDADDARAAAHQGDCVPMTATSCTTIQSKIDEGSTFNTVSIVSWIAGGALLATGITMVALGVTKKPAHGTATLIVPFLWPGGAAASLRGEF